MWLSRWLSSLTGALLLSSAFLPPALCRPEGVGPRIEISGGFIPLAPEHDPRPAPEEAKLAIHQQQDLAFSWNDPRIQERLWHNRPPPSGQIEKSWEYRGLYPVATSGQGSGERERRGRNIDAILPRAPPSGALQNVQPAAIFKVPSCLGCAQSQNGAPAPTLQGLSTTFLKSQILVAQPELYNRCLFYTGVEGTADKLKRRLKAISGHKNLSKLATDWACSKSLYTIWNLFSGGNSVLGSSSNPLQKNYWEIGVPGSWLYPLYNDRFAYFGQMSMAMAEVCGGVVYVMSLQPKNLARYGFIWANSELPTLRARAASNTEIFRPNYLVAVDAIVTSNQYVLNWTTLAVISKLRSPLKRSDGSDDDESLDSKLWLDVTEEEEEEEEAGRIEGRDSCDLNVNYEPYDEDWFGIGGTDLDSADNW